jgi:hypothetical protein
LGGDCRRARARRRHLEADVGCARAAARNLADMLPISKAGAWEAFEATDTGGEPACALALNRVNPAGGAIVVKSWGERTYCACA